MTEHDVEKLISKAAAVMKWVVYAKRPFGGPGQVLRYLARYIHRTAIGDSRILSVENQTVTFRYKDYRDHDRQKVMALHPHEFLRRFVQHVPPRGYVRVRAFGFIADTNKRKALEQIRAALGAPALEPPQQEPHRCPICGNGVFVELRLIKDLCNLPHIKDTTHHDHDQTSARQAREHTGVGVPLHRRQQDARPGTPTLSRKETHRPRHAPRPRPFGIQSP